MKKSFVLLLVVLALLFSCEKEEEDVYYKLTLGDCLEISSPMGIDKKSIPMGQDLVISVVNIPGNKVVDYLYINNIRKEYIENDTYYLTMEEDTEIRVKFANTCSLFLGSGIKIISPKIPDLNKIKEGTEVILRLDILNEFKAVEDLKDDEVLLNVVENVEDFNYKLGEDKVYVEQKLIIDKSYNLSIKYSDSIKIPGYDKYEKNGDDIILKNNDISNYPGYSGDILIPNFVTSIGEYAFSCNKANYYINELTSIIIPKSVKSIGQSAFKSCDKLSSITIPNGVTNIADRVFSECNKLNKITIPDGVIKIGESAFLNCKALEAITLPDGVTSIGKAAFLNCSALNTITIPDSVKNIGQAAFQNCSALNTITIPDGVTSIGYNTFNSCSNLNTIIIPDSIEYVYYGAFNETPFYNNLTVDSDTGLCVIGSVILKADKSKDSFSIPDKIKCISYNAFKSCSVLTSITIPKSVTSINDYAFDSCTQLSQIKIAEGVQSIGNTAFSNCGNSSSTKFTITIPKSVKYIGYCAFSGCENLETINCKITKKPDIWDNNWNKKKQDEDSTGLFPVVWNYTEN